MTPRNDGDIWRLDLFALPPFGWLGALLKTPTLANLKARHEALAVLFEELAIAVERGIPLDQALSMAGRPAKSIAPWARPRPAVSLKLLFGAVFAFAIGLAMSPLLLLGYLLMGPRMINAPAIARRLAARMHGHVVRGVPLSGAMQRMGVDFETSEIELVRMAEEGACLPAGLRSLARYQATEHRLLTQTGSLVYPILLLFILSTIAGFMLVKIVPRFVDIFEQIGVEFPPLTEAVIRVSHWSSTSLLLPLAAFALLLVVWYGLMNGSLVSRVLLYIMAGVQCAVVCMGAALGVAWGVVLAASLENTATGVVMMIAAGIVGLLVSVAATPLFLSFMENMLLLLHRALRRLLLHVPVLGAGARAERDARWMAAFSLALDIGRSAPDALRVAGRIARGGLEGRSLRAAEFAASGHSIGEACVRHALPDRRAAAMIAWKDESPDLLPSLRAIAADSSARATETMTRSNQAAEVAVQVAIGAVAGFFVVAMYLPLFQIPVSVAAKQ